MYYTKIDNQNLGTAILVKNEYVKYIKKYQILIEGRVQLLEIKNEYNSFNIINVYGPAMGSKRLAFYQEFIQRIKNIKNKIMMGDWNMILKKQETTGNFQNQNYSRLMKKYFEDNSLEDIHDN